MTTAAPVHRLSLAERRTVLAGVIASAPPSVLAIVAEVEAAALQAQAVQGLR